MLFSGPREDINEFSGSLVFIFKDIIKENLKVMCPFQTKTKDSKFEFLPTSPHVFHVLYSQGSNNEALTGLQ